MTNIRETSDTFIAELLRKIDARAEGEIAYALIERLYPICRSITGNGVRRSLRLLRETIPLALREVTSDTPVFDWTVPDEWNIRDAYIMNKAGERVVDFRKSNLHVLNYSLPVNRAMSLANFDRIFSPCLKLRIGSLIELLTIKKIGVSA